MYVFEQYNNDPQDICIFTQIKTKQGHAFQPISTLLSPVEKYGCLQSMEIMAVQLSLLLSFGTFWSWYPGWINTTVFCFS